MLIQRHFVPEVDGWVLEASIPAQAIGPTEILDAIARQEHATWDLENASTVPTMSRSHKLHLIRHGEVSNPNHVVYGDLPGFHLSPTGVRQVYSTGRHLTNANLDIVVTSPIIRAVETATAVARPHGLTPQLDNRLTESGQFPHWLGLRWEELPGLFPDELESYLEDANHAGGTETLSQIAARYRSVIEDTTASGHRSIAIIGHQDTIQAARLDLTGRDLGELRIDPPHHGEVVTLSRPAGATWIEASRWAPAIPTS